MKFWVVLFFQVSLCAFAFDCQQYIGQCGYYSCIAQQMNCAQENYLLKFAKPKCQCFVDENSSFSKVGQETLAHLRRCLQLKIERDQDILTCDTVENIAQIHHIDCYVESGYCQLPWEDRNKILGVVFWDILFDSKFQDTGFKILEVCRSLGYGFAHD